MNRFILSCSTSKTTDNTSGKLDRIHTPCVFDSVTVVSLWYDFQHIVYFSKLLQLVEMQHCFNLTDLFRWGIQIETFQENRLDKSKLHLALISAIKKAGRGNQLQVLPEICKLIQELRIKRESMEAISYNEELLTGATLEKVVDLLLQLIQMLISVECLDLNGIRKLKV